MVMHLSMDANTCSLSQNVGGDQVVLATLPHGAGGWLGQAALTEVAIEAAIQHAEDWLMPHASGLRGQVLQVHDTTGRVRAWLQAEQVDTGQVLGVETIERVFETLVERVVRYRGFAHMHVEPDQMAAIVLLRELAHHGQIAGAQITD